MEATAVVDTNLIFSALISNASTIRTVLLDERYLFYAPNFVFVELFKHKEKILRYTKLNEDEFYAFFNSVIERIRFLPIEIVGLMSRQRGYDLCKDIDVHDIPFLSLAVELDLPLWTGDKKLKNGLIGKGYSNFYEPLL